MEASSASTTVMQSKKDPQFSEKETSSTSLPFPVLSSLRPSLVPTRTVHSTIDHPSSHRSSSTRATTEFHGHRIFAAAAASNYVPTSVVPSSSKPSSSLYQKRQPQRVWQPLPDPKTVDAASKKEGFPVSV